MIEAVEFLTYATGCSIVIISTAVAIRLIRKDLSKSIAVEKNEERGKKWEAISDPSADNLVDRLTAFQSARFSSPIVSRTDVHSHQPRSIATAQRQRIINEKPLQKGVNQNDNVKKKED